MNEPNDQPTRQVEQAAPPKPRALMHPDLRLMELAERNPSAAGRELLREIIERGARPALSEPAPVRDLAAALRPRSLDDPAYRTPAELSAQLQRESPALRELYERGATLKGDTLILPAEAHELADEQRQPWLTTLTYAEQKLPDRTHAQEFYELAKTISGTTADARTELTVFRIYYDRLGRDEGGQRLEKQDTAGQQKAVTRTLAEMNALAQEMAQLETRASLEIEPALAREFAATGTTANVGARFVDLRGESLRWPDGLSEETKARLLTRTLPELDYRLEKGVPLVELLRAIDRSMARPDAFVSQAKRSEIGGFLKQYLDERLRDPETRAAHFSPAFRQARAMFEQARTSEEVGRAAEDFYRANRERNVAQRLHLADSAKHAPPIVKPLDARERNLLFFGRAPAHYTSAMRELRIAYGLTQNERHERVARLQSGVLEPTSPLQELLAELDTRRTVKAVNHFQASLLNELVAPANRVNLAQLERQLPPHERAYLFDRTQARKQALQNEQQRPPAAIQEVSSTRTAGELPRTSSSLREYLAHLGRIERQLLNAALAERERGEAQREFLTITAARQRLPEVTAQQVRLRASQLAWEALTPKEVLARDPSPTAVQVRQTLVFLQEELQPRARVAQAARDQSLASPLFTLEPVGVRLAALESYATERREAFYRGFELLDQQRQVWEQAHREEELAREPEAVSSRALAARPDAARPVANEATQRWHFDRLGDALVVEQTNAGSNPRNEDVHVMQITHEWER